VRMGVGAARERGRVGGREGGREGGRKAAGWWSLASTAHTGGLVGLYEWMTEEGSQCGHSGVYGMTGVVV
jgi:hypothetical protein